jgi:hypothetical protein
VPFDYTRCERAYKCVWPIRIWKHAAVPNLIHIAERTKKFYGTISFGIALLQNDKRKPKPHHGQQECHSLHHEVLRYLPHKIYDPYSFIHPCRCSVCTIINVRGKSSIWLILVQKYAYVYNRLRKKHTCGVPLSERWVNTLLGTRCKV